MKRRFIDNSPTIEILFLLTYTLARLRKISAEADYTRRHVFAGMVELNLLFDITVIIEEAIKHKNPTRQQGNGRPLTFIHQVEYVLRQEGRALAPDELGEINGQFNATFDVALQAALNGTMTLQNGTILSRYQADLALAYGIRNHGAHNTGTAPTIWQRFPDVQNTLFRVLCATIDHLYP